MSEKNKPNEIYITRVYNAPLKMVWDAWMDPEQKAKWWGPRGFTITTHSSDVRTGGTWDYTMHGPDGTDYPNVTKYLEVERYQRMVYDHGGTHDKPALFRVTALFSENNGKTTLDMTMSLPTPEAAAETKKFIKQAGGNATWDRLAEFLSPEVDRFVINRTFDISRDQMFEMWTDSKHISQWLPPTGYSMNIIKDEIKEGGTTFFSMENEMGMKMYGKIFYKEITKPNRIVSTQIFCDEHGNTSRHPMAPTWPEAMLRIVELNEEGKNSTRVTVTWEVYGEATALERETFNKSKTGMTQGWTGSFDKLDEYLTKAL